MSPGQPSLPVRDVIGYVLGALQSAPRDVPRDAALLARISLTAERLLGIGGNELTEGVALAYQYYIGARQARSALAATTVTGPAIQASVAAFLPPNSVVPDTLVGVRIYFEEQSRSGAWIGKSIVVNVRAGSGIQDVVRGALAAYQHGDIGSIAGSPPPPPTGGGIRNATIIGLAGYERNGANTLVLPE